MKNLITYGLPDDNNKITIGDLTTTYIQEKDCCDSSNIDEYYQELKFSVDDGGGGPFFILETNRWAFSNINEISNIFNDFNNKANIVNNRIKLSSLISEINIPVSLGELYDKITILKIKQERIQDESKLKSINKELSLLSNIIDSYDQDLFDQLMNTNKSLWNIEDKIREKERKKEFDDEFIQLARNVYFTNDKRSEIKRQINIKYNSNIIEEKSYKEY